MATKRRSRGFQPVARVRARDLGLPRRRAQELELGRAWRAVAGAALALKARAVSVDRGTLVLQVVDSRWADTVRGLVRTLAGRLAHRYPELGVRRLRVKLTDADAARTLPVEPIAHESPVEQARAPDRVETEEPGDIGQRLARLASRYLDAQKP